MTIHSIWGDNVEAKRTAANLPLVNPDQAAEQNRIGSELGVPPSIVAQDVDLYRTQVQRQKNSTILAKSPLLREWISTPENAAVASDDVENLGMLEALPNALNRGASRALTSVQMVPALGAAATGGLQQNIFDQAEALDPALSNFEIAERLGLDPQSRLAFLANSYVKGDDEMRARLRSRSGEIIQRSAEELVPLAFDMRRIAKIPMSAGATRFRDTFFEGDQASLGDIFSTIANDPLGAMAFFTEVAAESVPELAAASLLTRGVGAGLGRTSVGAGSLITEGVGQVDEFLQEAGADISTPEGAMAALSNQGLMQSAAAAGLARGLIIGALDTLSGGIAGRQLAASPMGDLLVQGLVQASMGGGGEALAQYAVDGEVDLRDVVVEALAEFVTTPIEVVGVAGRSLAKDARRAGRAGQTAEALGRIGEIANQSKLRERDPKAFRGFVDTTGLRDTDVSVPADDLNTFFQANDLSPSAFEIGETSFEDALTSGGDVVIPASVYADKIAGTEFEAFFAENASRDGEMSISEAQRFNEEWQTEMMRIAEEAQAEFRDDLESRSGDIQVRDALFTQLREAGRSPDVADREAAVWAAFFRAQGDRYGEDALDLARQFGVRVEGPQTAEARVRGDLDIALNTLRRGLPGQPTQQSLVDWIIARGGVSGVDIPDAPQGLLVDGQRTFEGGAPPTSVDQVARSAVENGFLPELSFLNDPQHKASADDPDPVAAFVEALERELRDGPEAVADQDAEALRALAAEIERLGIDITTATNDEVVQALQEARGQTLFQIAPPTESEAFKKWFGDSKVVDENGDPMVVYHGTGQDFEAFDLGEFGATDDGWFGKGVYLSAQTSGDFDVNFYAPRNGGQVIPAFARIENPLVITSNAPHWFGDSAEEATAAAIERGYDGVMFYSDGIEALPSEIVAFSPEQIKSVHNRGTFDPGDPRILYQSNAVTSDSINALEADLKERFDLRSLSMFLSGNNLKLNMIAVGRDKMGAGTGTRVMEEITEFADQNGLRVVLTPGQKDDSFGTTSNARLRKFYKRFGFVENKGRRKDFTISEAMYRDPALHQEARGSITFPTEGIEQGETVIRLFESANLSTFLHESGHFFLEATRALAERDDAPEGIKADLETVNAFLKHEGGAYSTESHEKWARAFEAYLMEGKAPSLELADAFARFKAWLVRIYRTIAGLNVKLTPEIREVMDRMLATDAEIAAARADQAMRPLFDDAAVAGMTQAEFTPYQRMAQRSAEQAEQRLLEKTMGKVRREKEAWFKEEKKAVREEVEASVAAKREYQLIDLLANRQWTDGSAQDLDIQIDRGELVARYGEGVIAELSRTRLGGKRAVYSKGGASPDTVAEMFGFENADDMIATLQNTMKKKDFIVQEVDRIMVERHGDPLNDGSIEEEALAAIHSDQQAHTVAAEARQLAKRQGADARNITARVFRQRARQMLGRMPVKDAAKPARFLSAERQHARSAEKAFSDIVANRGDANEKLATARRHKEQQLLNHYLYMEARDLEAAVKRGREKMRSYSKASVRAKLDGVYIDQIDRLLEQYEFRQVTQREVDRRASLAEYVDEMIAAGRESELAIDPRLIENARKVHYSRMTVDELNGLFDTIANIDHMGRFKQKLIDAKEKRDLDAIAAEVAQGVSSSGGTPPGRTETSGEKARKTVRDYLNLTLNADTLLREMDGFKDLGPVWTALKSKIDSGMARLVERRQQMAKDFDDLYSVYSTAEQRDMNVKRSVPALAESLSKWDLIALALNTGNQDNFERLQNSKAYGYSAGQIEEALQSLDDRDWRFVQSMWDYIGSYWPEIEAKEKRLTGAAPKKVEARAMVPAREFLKGGYFPISYDNRLSGVVEDFADKNLAESLMGGRFGKAQTRNGHTKERSSTTGLPVSLDISVAHQHINQVLYDLELGEHLSNSWRILQHTNVKSAFFENGKRSDFEALELWLLDTAAGEQVAARGLEKWLRHVRSGFTVSRLALNISTALIQPSGLFQSAVQVGKRDMTTGFMSYMSAPGRWIAEMSEASPMMRERQLTFQRDIFNVVGDVQGGPTTGKFEKFQRDVILPASFWLMQKVQFYAVDAPTWVAAYQQELKRSGDEARARVHADTMVKRAQGSGLMSDRGMLERGTTAKESRQREFPRMLTALGSYMFAKFNVAYERTGRTDFRSPTEVMSFAMDMALLFTMEAFLYSLVKGGLPDEEEDESHIQWAVEQTALSAMATLPYFREVSGALQGFGGGGIFGSGVEALARPLTQTAQGEADKSWLKSVVNAGGVLLHLPASQVNVMIDAIFDPDLNVRGDVAPIEFFIRQQD